ncbi:MFS transporter [Anaerobacillus alkaliphilus]|uniref:MFS transporter n=1 Tax=Anaerobacillus alkaliphilus TaxID=1548597 RepID=A0A4Q0VPG9_9BACI|nr:MFS transporter [Anaerobacillus alkaliphilus]RXI98372.1 MFS transporter [Anaerobacillus alkaliphilus]
MDLNINKNNSQKTITAVALVTAICLLGDSMLYIALPIYYKEVGLQSLWEVGLILSLNRLIRIPINPFVGWVYRKISLKLGLIISVILAVITTVGYGIGHGLFIWIILRCLWGISWSFLRLGGMFTVIEYATDENRGRLMGLYNGLYRLGSLFGMLLGGILVSIYGFSFVSICFGLLMIASFPLISWLVPSVNSEKVMGVPYIDSLKSLVTKQVMLVIVSGLLLALIIQGMFVSTLSLVMQELFTNEINIIGFTLGITALAGIIQGVRWAWEPFVAMRFGQLSDGNKGRLPLFIFFLMTGAISFSLLPVGMPMPIWISITFLFMFSSTILTTLIDAIAADVGKKSDLNVVMTYYTVFLDFGAALGPILAYFIIGYQNGLFLSFFLGGSVLVILALLWSKEQVTLRKHQELEQSLL